MNTLPHKYFEIRSKISKEVHTKLIHKEVYRGLFIAGEYDDLFDMLFGRVSSNVNVLLQIEAECKRKSLTNQHLK